MCLCVRVYVGVPNGCIYDLCVCAHDWVCVCACLCLVDNGVVIDVVA
jgi:hypothetical protein